MGPGGIYPPSGIRRRQIMYIIVFYRYSQANYRGLVVELHLVPYAGFLTTNVVGLLYSSHGDLGVGSRQEG